MRKYHDQQVYDHIVIGIGGMGSSACYFLSLSGNSVLGLEANDIPNQLGSSHGYSRIIRLAYHEHPNYVPLLKRAYQIYEEIEEITKSKVMFVTGCVEAGPKGNSLVQGTIESSKLHRLEYEEMSGEQVNQRFRGFRIPDDYQAVYQPKGGFLDPELCISNFVKLACANGAEIRAREKVVKWEKCGDIIQVTSNKGVYYSRKLCICAGAWSSELIQELKEANALQIERQVLGWFMPKKNSTDDFKLGNFPVFIVDSGKYQVYGFPEYRVPGFKIGRFHHRYQILQSGDKLYQNPIDENDEQVLRECLEDFFPEANGPVMSMNACMFSLSPDEHFIIDFLPNYDNQVVIAAGFSGHGFKFVGVVGEVLSQLLTEGKSNLDIDFFRVGRVLKSEK